MWRILLLLQMTVPLWAYKVTTEGPRGEVPIASSFITLSRDEAEQVRGDSLSLAILLHDTLSDFSKVLLRSVEEAASKLNIEIVSVASAAFSEKTQNEQYWSLLDSPPDLLITLALSPTDSYTSLKQLSDSGTAISFLSNLPDSLDHPEQYASVITDDLFGMGRAMADLIVRESGEDVRLLYIYHDADYYVTNQRDQALLSVLELAHPKVKVTDSIPMSSPNSIAAEFEELLRQRGSEFDAVYTPWATIAEEILPAIKAFKESPLKLYTIDLNDEIFKELLLGTAVGGIVADRPQELGRSLLISAVLHHYNLPAPPFAVVPVETITADNCLKKWRDIMGIPFREKKYE